MSYKRCKACGQPVLKKGQERKHFTDYRHAFGCPLDDRRPGTWRRADAIDVKHTRRNAAHIPLRFWWNQLGFMLFFYRIRTFPGIMPGGEDRPMHTAYLIVFYNAAFPGVSPIVYAGVYSEPSPTCSSTWAPIVIVQFTRETYDDANRLMKHWLSTNQKYLASNIARHL